MVAEACFEVWLEAELDFDAIARANTAHEFSNPDYVFPVPCKSLPPIVPSETSFHGFDLNIHTLADLRSSSKSSTETTTFRWFVTMCEDADRKRRAHDDDEAGLSVVLFFSQSVLFI